MRITGSDNIEAIVQGRVCILTPTLRCALRLHATYRDGVLGLSALARDIAEGSLTGALAILSLFDDRPDLAEIILLDGVWKHQGALTKFVLALMGHDTTEPKKSAPKGSAKPKGGAKTQSIEDYLEGLYRIGTGWLGWAPDVTLDATPAQIMEAHAGKIEMLKAIHGSSDTKTQEEPAGPWDRNVRSIFAGMGTVKVEASDGGGNVE